MFGLATKEDVEALEAKFEALRKAVAGQNKDLSTKLYTVEVFDPGGHKLGTYRDVYEIDQNQYGSVSYVVGSLILKARDGSTILRGNGYTYVATEQKAEPEPKRGNYEWVIKADDLKEKGYGEWMRELYNSPCTQGQASNMRAHLEKEMGKKYDELMHKIELLETRLGNKSFGKQAQPTKLAKR